MIKMNEKEFKNYFSNNIKSISSKLSLEEINFLCNLVKAFDEVCEKYDKSQNNWNELKKWLEEIIEDIDKIEYPDSYDKGEKATLKNILRHMQEMEQGKDE